MINIKHSIFIEKVKRQVGNEYTFLGEYTKAKDKIPVIHNKCGHTYEVTPENFTGVNSRRCPKCSVKNKKQSIPFSQEEFIARIFEAVGDEYTVLGDYKGQNVKFLIRHNTCGNEYMVNYKNFRRGRRCKECKDEKRRKTHEEFSNEVFILGNGKYALLDGYKGNEVKITFQHLECGFIYKCDPSNFIAGNRCPSCKISKGEAKIKEFLDSRGIQYKREGTYEGVKDVHPLRFDFVLEEVLPNQHIIIEYDGEHHFVPVKHWGGEKSLKLCQKRDSIKNEFAKTQGHIMIRIPYWEFKNIEKILDEKLKELSVHGEKSNGI